MRFSYHTEQWLPYPVEDVFAFFADPENLPKLMPPWQKARIDKMSLVPPPRSLAPHAPANVAGAGTGITLSFRPFRLSPIRVRWQAEITEFTWNSRFCDRQIRGPFAFWNHCHRMRAVDREGIDVTLVADHVEYELPLGPAGKLAHRIFVQRQINRMFAFRQHQVAELLAQTESKRPQPHRPPQSHPKSA